MPQVRGSKFQVVTSLVTSLAIEGLRANETRLFPWKPSLTATRLLSRGATPFNEMTGLVPAIDSAAPAAAINSRRPTSVRNGPRTRSIAHPLVRRVVQVGYLLVVIPA